MVVGCVLAVARLNCAAAVPIIADADFSVPSLGGLSHQDYPTGTSFGSWTAEGPVSLYKSDYNNLGLTLPPDQSQAVYLSPATFSFGGVNIMVPGEISQGNVQGFIPGQEYTLTFALGVLPGSGSGTVTVQFDYTAQDGVTRRITRTAQGTMQWASAITTPFSIPATQATITFIGPSSGIGVAVGGPMTFTPVPEPYQYGLVGVLGLLSFAGKKSLARSK